jgi:hypothetical protein
MANLTNENLGDPRDLQIRLLPVGASDLEIE